MGPAGPRAGAAVLAQYDHIQKWAGRRRRTARCTRPSGDVDTRLTNSHRVDLDTGDHENIVSLGNERGLRRAERVDRDRLSLPHPHLWQRTHIGQPGATEQVDGSVLELRL